MRQPSKTSLFAVAKRWDAASVGTMLARAPELAGASAPKGRAAHAPGVRCTAAALPRPRRRYMMHICFI